MKYNLILSSAQAGALARLIQTHLAAYDEAVRGLDDGQREGPPGEALQPFTGADLDLIEPLAALFKKLSKP